MTWLLTAASAFTVTDLRDIVSSLSNIVFFYNFKMLVFEMIFKVLIKSIILKILLF